MFLCLLLLYLAAAVAPVLCTRFPAKAWLPLAALPLGIAIYLGATFLGAGIATQAFDWVPGLDIQLALRLDGLGLVFSLLVCGVGALILTYSSAYFEGDARLGRLLGCLLLFQASMLGMVLADDAISLFVFWEGTSIASYLLIGFDHEKAKARQAAFRALFVTGGGGLALLVGLLLITEVTGTSQISAWALQADSLQQSALYPALLACVLLGAVTKSAQFPFHFWLPGAMAAPTPVSAYLHSATMVKAGIYLLLRLHPSLGGSEAWQWSLASMGSVTLLLGAVLAIGQKDLKALLAYTTVAGLGTLVLLIGIGTPLALQGALLFLVVHALYKGALFLVAGIVDHEAGTRDLDRLGGLFGAMPRTAWVALLAGASMAGLPPLLGFLGKEIAYEALLGAPAAASLWIAVAVAANAFVIASAVLLVGGTFFGSKAETPKPAHDPGWRMLLPPALLAVLGLLLGLLPQTLAAPLIQAAWDAIGDPDLRLKYALWHGFNLVLKLSLLTMVLGVLVAVGARFLARAGSALWKALGDLRATAVFDAFIAGLMALAKGQTRLFQRPTSDGDTRLVLLAVFLCLGVCMVWLGGPQLPQDFGSLEVGQVEALALTATGALATCLAAGRIAARVVLLGVTGLGVAATFLSGGGLDLALTQLAVETLAVLLFAFALLHTPMVSAPSSGGQRLRDGALSLVAGVLLALSLWTAIAEPAEAVLREAFVANSLPGGKGRNIVNVVLVDFRALDTLGEITVLGLASLGVLALLRTGKEQVA